MRRHEASAVPPIRRACLAGFAVAGAALLFVRSIAPRGGFEDAPASPFVRLAVEGRVPGGFCLRAQEFDALFRDDGIAIRASGSEVRIRFEGAHAGGALETLGPARGYVNVRWGGDEAGWRDGPPAHNGLIYRGVYPGVDVECRATQRGFKAEYRLAAGADPGAIRIRYEGARAVRMDASGALVVETDAGGFRESAPVAYQQRGAVRTPVASAYRMLGPDLIGFDLGPYDPRFPLVIDPELIYSGALGGRGSDAVYAAAVDGAGNMYLAGATSGAGFPAYSAFQARAAGGMDAFVMKLSPSGELIYSTLLGGSGDDRAFALAVDGSGAAYVAGWTDSRNFPAAGSWKRAVVRKDGFVAKLAPNGRRLEYSAIVGGSGYDAATALALGSEGSAYIAGYTDSWNLPLASAFARTLSGGTDAFAAKVGPSGELRWTGYLGGRGDDRAQAVAVSRTGQVYLAGRTTSVDFPLITALQTTRGGASDAFVAVAPDGAALAYATLLGGGREEQAAAIAVDSAGDVYLAGDTDSLDFPVERAPYPALRGLSKDAFVTKLRLPSQIVYSTYLGGMSLDRAKAIAVGADGEAIVAGETFSEDFPVSGGFQGRAGGYDGFVARLRPDGSALAFSSYYGGDGNDSVSAVALDARGPVIVGGLTFSVQFPVRGGHRLADSGWGGGFVGRIGGSASVAPSATAVFRDASGRVRLTAPGRAALSDSGFAGAAGNPAAIQDSAGTTIAATRDAQGRIWVSRHRASSQSWDNWVCAGGSAAGDPAIARAPDGSLSVFVRDSSGRYLANRQRADGGFDGWNVIGSSFASDPAAATAADGTIHILARDAWGGIRAGRYASGAGMLGWTATGASAKSNPAVVAGPDGAVYAAALDSSNSLWFGRFEGAGWEEWSNVGGEFAGDPDLAATATEVHVVAADESGGSWVRSINAQTRQWRPWVYIGQLKKPAAAATRSNLLVVGRDLLAGDIFWYEHEGAGWTKVGYPGVMASVPSACPR